MFLKLFFGHFSQPTLNKNANAVQSRHNTFFCTGFKPVRKMCSYACFIQHLNFGLTNTFDQLRIKTFSHLKLNFFKCRFKGQRLSTTPSINEWNMKGRLL